MTNETIITFIWSVVNAIVSVLLEVIPGLKEKWNDLEYKPAILLGFATLVPLALWALSCYAGMAFVEVDCAWQGAFKMVIAGFIAFLANQTTFSLKSRELPNAVARANGVQ